MCQPYLNFSDPLLETCLFFIWPCLIRNCHCVRLGIKGWLVRDTPESLSRCLILCFNRTDHLYLKLLTFFFRFEFIKFWIMKNMNFKSFTQLVCKMDTLNSR